MPIVFTYDVETSTANANDRTRVNLCFERLGWEHVGGSAWRYPILGTSNASEDWMNHVIPALMYFRSVACRANWNVTKFTLDAHSEAGYRGVTTTPVGQPIQQSAAIAMYAPTPTATSALSEQVLRAFIEASTNSV